MVALPAKLKDLKIHWCAEYIEERHSILIFLQVLWIALKGKLFTQVSVSKVLHVKLKNVAGNKIRK